MKIPILVRTSWIIVCLGTVAARTPALAQTRDTSHTPPSILIGGFDDERLRLRQVSGDATLAGSLLRSVSSLTPLLPDTAARSVLAWRIVMPQYHYVYNSDLPYSLNDGALWAGRGSNIALVGGVRAQWTHRRPIRFLDSLRVRLFLLPEVVASENRSFKEPFLDRRQVPPLPPTRNAWSSPWHAGPQSIDLPWRHGDETIGQFILGQSSLIVDAWPVSFGFATENEWWGPGIRNALLLSNNARGFPHLFLRNAAPIVTRAGTFEARWLAGWTHESNWFDTDTLNDRNSISMLAFTWQPPHTSIVLGAARSVIAPTSRPRRALESAFKVFNDGGQPNAKPITDSTMKPGPDQLISLFWRWVEPRDRFEFYGEWARAEFPVSLRDFLVQPNHTQGYTLGLQWLGDTLRWDLRLRVQAEVSFLEQSTTYRQRPIGSWYTSRAVSQGYTNEGQVIGAAIGPGSSSQFISLGVVAPKWLVSPYVTRIRWMEDARSQMNYNLDAGSRGFCEHDVSLLPGLRVGAETRAGTLQADFSSGWRLNVFYEHKISCLSSFGEGARDVRNKSLTVTWVPRGF